MKLDNPKRTWPMIEAAYGKAVLASHALERNLALHVSIWQVFKTRKHEAFATMHRSLLKKPLGEVMRIGKASGAIPDDLYEALDNARLLRNHLVHEISDSITLRAFTKKESTEAIVELLEIADDFRGISQEILKMARLYFEVAGISIDDVRKRTRSIIERASQVDRLKDICPDRHQEPTPP